MNYAFMSFSCPEATLTEVFKLAKTFGYAGVEPRVESNHEHGIELGLSSTERIEVKQLSENEGIELCCLALGTSFANPESVQAHIDKTLHYLDLAVEVGCKRLRVFGGKLPEDVNREQGTALLVNSLQQLAPEAGARDLVLCLETHDDWCTPAQVAGVMQRVDHPAIAVNWDIMHPLRAGGASMQEAFETLRPWIKHVHIHDGLKTLETLTMVPMGTGELEPKAAMHLLKGAAYDGFLSGEWIKGTMSKAFFATHLSEEIAVLKRYEGEL